MADEMQDSTRQPAQEPQGQAGQKMPAEQGRGERTRARRTFRPQVDIYETENGLMLLADVPGAKPEGLAGCGKTIPATLR